jgi:uncharacterized RDD family membrane protein YckC
MTAPRAGTDRPGAQPGAARELYAGLVSRMLALGVDASLLAVAALVIGLGAPALWSAVDGSAPHWLRAGADVVVAVLPLLYFWIGWVRGRTVGCFLVGVVVRRKNGAPLGTVRAGVRAFVGLMFAPVWLVGMVLTLADPRRRALHDLLLKTVVLRG